MRQLRKKFHFGGKIFWREAQRYGRGFLFMILSIHQGGFAFVGEGPDPAFLKIGS
jgi:hypothetical protein